MDSMVFTLFWVFGWVLLLILIWHLKGRRREKRMEMIHKERMMAMEKGIPLPELPDFAEPGRSALAAAVASLRINPRWPLGRGALFAMVGAGTSLALWLTPERDPHNAWPVGLIGVFGSATPDGPYEAALESERMRAVARLVEELRSVVRMHYWMDQSIEEIAGALDVPRRHRQVLPGAGPPAPPRAREGPRHRGAGVKR